jgi:hypothetical protein
MSVIPITSPDDRDLSRCAMIGQLVIALENAGRAIDQLAAVWPQSMREAAASIVKSGEDIVSHAREIIA